MSKREIDSRPLVMHVIYRFATGGMENGIVNLVNQLPHESYRHVIVCLTTSGEFESRIQRPDIDVVELHKRAGKDIAVYWRFFRLVKKLRPAIVHTRNLGTVDLSIVAKLAGVPVRIHGEHGWDNSDPTGTNRKYLALRRLCRRFISRYVTVSLD
ncbi:MAG: glycosyltransferase, partial [Pseudomonadota bacterium]